MELTEIQAYVKQTLSKKRYYHSICVMERCAELAKHYNQNIEEAKKVGILHDIAKEMNDEEKITYAKENGLEIDQVEQSHPRTTPRTNSSRHCKKEIWIHRKNVWSNKTSYNRWTSYDYARQNTIRIRRNSEKIEHGTK